MSQGNRFGSLSAGMIVRGSVPAQVLFGAGTAISPRPPQPPAETGATAPPLAVSPAPAPMQRGGAEPRPPRKTVTFRLDPAQHMRLRVLGAYQRRSAQDILVQALTAYLDSAPAPAAVPGGEPIRPCGSNCRAPLV